MKSRVITKKLSKLHIAVIAIIAGALGSYVVFFSSAATACTTTANSIATIQSAVTNASDGATVCIAPGSYGHVTLTRTGTNHTADVTLQSDPTLDPNGAGSVTINGMNVQGNYITVRNLHFMGGGITVGTSSGPFPPYTHVTIDHNEVGPVNGYGITVSADQHGSTLASFITISNNKIHDTSSTTEGDAIRIDGWRDVTISGNEIYNIKECPAGNCHTDTLQSYMANVSTSNLTITKNYLHDNQAQGLPFINDGDVSNITVTDNLSVRMPSSGISGFWILGNSNSLKVSNNTYVGTTGSALKNDTSSKPIVQVDHNVLDQFNISGSGGFAMTEDYNVYTANNQWSFTIGPHSVKNSNPGFVNTATDDYRLASNPNNIGVTWKPSDYTYGPVNDSGGSDGCTVHATPSDANSKVAAAKGGDTVCLDAGTYSDITISNNNSRTSYAAVKPSPGISNIDIGNLLLNNVSYLTFKNITFHGGFFTGHHFHLTDSTGVQGNDSSTQTHSRIFKVTGTISNADILIDHITYNDIPNPCTNNQCVEGRISIMDGGNPSGITISNSVFSGGSSDGIQLLGDSVGVHIVGNEFSNIKANTTEHTDAIQLYYNGSGTVIENNYIHDCDSGVMAPNGPAGPGGTNEQVIGNVFDLKGYPFDINLWGWNGGLIAHNTFRYGTTCSWNSCGIPWVQSMNSGTLTIRDNIIGEWKVDSDSSMVSEHHNLINIGKTNSNKGAGSIIGLPTYVSSNPTKWSDFALAAGSLGKGAASDGTDMGASYFGATSTTGTPTPKTGDLNADSQVNIFDLSILLSNYGKTKAQASNPACDLNNDSTINIFDLSILLSNYGK